MDDSNNSHLPYDQRPTHVYIPGKTRHGKSTLIFWMALQDIANGEGVTVMDAKGDLNDKLLKAIPEERVEDALYLDLDTPVPIDFMSYQNEREKEALIGDLKFVLLKTVEPEHAPLMNANLENELYTLLNYNENSDVKPVRRATFLDIYWFFENEPRRREILNHVTDPDLKAPWNPEKFPKPIECSRITTRMTPFVRSKSLRAIFGAPDPKLNIEQALKTKKIILAVIGIDEISSIYGSLLISKIRQATMRQAKLPQSQRIAHYLYCDEFQNFQTPDFDTILSMAGGCGLCLTLAHQYVEQLDSRILAAIKGNVSTFICFRLGIESANALRGEFPSMDTEQVYKRSPETGMMRWVTRPIPFDPHTLTHLPVGHVLYRNADGAARFIETYPPPEFTSDGYAELIKKRTVGKYSCDTLELFYPAGDVASRTQSAAEKEIQPGPPPNIPPNPRQKKKPRTAR